MRGGPAARSSASSSQDDAPRDAFFFGAHDTARGGCNSLARARTSPPPPECDGRWPRHPANAGDLPVDFHTCLAPDLELVVRDFLRDVHRSEAADGFTPGFVGGGCSACP